MAGGGLQNPNLTFPQLYDEARQSMPILQRQGDAMVADLQKRHPGLFDSAHFEMGPLKTEDRAQGKIQGDYKGDHSKIADLARARIVIDKPEQVEAIRTYLKEHKDGFKIEVMKDRFAKPSDTNFRDINMQVRLENGHVVEMRVEHQDILNAAKKTHDPYEEVQGIERSAKAEGRLLTDQEALQRQAILDHIRDVHGEPAQKAGMDRLLNDEGRQKMAQQELERIHPRAANEPVYNKPGLGAGLGHATGAASVAIDLASGNYGAAAGDAAMSAATSKAGIEAAEKIGIKVIGEAAKNIGKRIPVIGAVVTAGFVAYESGKYAVQGEGAKAGAALAAGTAEVAGNVFGFGVGDAAREAVREGVIAVGGKKFEGIEKSGLRQLGESAYSLATEFNSKAPATPTQVAEIQANILNKAGLGSLQKDGKTLDVGAILRDPVQSKSFIDNLDRAAKETSNPDIRRNVDVMAKASREYVALEDRRQELNKASNAPVFAQTVPQAPKASATGPQVLAMS